MIAKIGETTIVKTGKVGPMDTSIITEAGITAVGMVVGIPEPAGATCGTTTRLQRRSV